MTITALKAAIGLIIARQAAHGNKEEQKRINAKLDKLYELKAILIAKITERNACGRFNVTAHTVASADSAKTEV